MNPTGTATGLLTAAEFLDWANRPENAGRHFELVRGRSWRGLVPENATVSSVATCPSC